MEETCKTLRLNLILIRIFFKLHQGLGQRNLPINKNQDVSQFYVVYNPVLQTEQLLPQTLLLKMQNVILTEQ